ncbi:MAG: DUF1641 domain-containing protein [Actinobacteria bacterium]|nr:DUF1641 domain-containing protein [Actinomycetota bacterium]
MTETVEVAEVVESAAAVPDPVAMQAQLDRLSAQMDWMVGQMQQQAATREQWSELVETMVPVTRGFMDVATRELEELGQDVTIDDVTRFARTLVRSLPQLEALLAQLDSMSELLATANSLSGAGVAKLTEVLQTAEDKGYFMFAQQGAAIADKVVTEFTEDDVKALGDNVVTILNAVKEMTQPEVMGLVRRTAVTMQEEEIGVEPPSLFALLKSMRDPQTRRGLARVMAMLHTVGEEPAMIEGSPTSGGSSA